MKKIEINIASFILIESIFLLFCVKESLLNILFGFSLGFIITYFIKKIKFNKFIEILLLLISIFLSIIITFKITNYITYNLLRNYSKLVIMISFLSISIYLSIKGYHTFIKAIELSGYIYLFIKIISFIFLIFNIDYNNYKMINFNINYNFIIIALLASYIYLIIKYLANYNITFKDNLINSINPFLMKLLVIGILGNTLTNMYKYPYINILKRIRYLNFFERMEGILGFSYLISFYFLLSFIILVIIILFKDIFKRNT